MSNEIVITVAGNVYAPALAVLKRLGFTVTAQGGRNANGERQFSAVKPGVSLHAEDLLLLLGLAKLVEERGAEWFPTDKEVEAFLSLTGHENA